MEKVIRLIEDLEIATQAYGKAQGIVDVEFFKTKVQTLRLELAHELKKQNRR